MATQIRQISNSVYQVNGKQVDTARLNWGRNLTAGEYRQLQEYRRSTLKVNAPAGTFPVKCINNSGIEDMFEFGGVYFAKHTKKGDYLFDSPEFENIAVIVDPTKFVAL